MRTLVVSDLHSGDPRCENTSFVLKVLRETNYDQLILNGDIVDLWLVSPAQIKTHPVVIELSRIAKNKKVIWVLGNHDWDARGQNIIPGAEEVESYTLKTSNHDVFFIHGHQVYEFQNMPWYSKLLTKINFWFWQKTGINFQRFLNRGPMYVWLIRYRRKEIIKQYKDKSNTIVIGHTHLFGCSSSSKTTVFDIGSLPIRKTYCIINDNGDVLLQKFQY